VHFLSTQLDTSLHCEITDTRLTRSVCLFVSHISLVFILPTHTDGQAELTWMA